MSIPAIVTEKGRSMSGLKAIGMVLGGLWLVLMILIGAGNAYYDKRARQAVPRDIPEASDDEYRAGYRPSDNDEAERDYRRRREGVTIESGSARPMVDVDPNR
jgi:hypothetical protein